MHFQNLDIPVRDKFDDLEKIDFTILIIEKDLWFVVLNQV